MTESAARTLEADVALESLDLVHDTLTAWWEEVGEVDLRTRFAFETAVIEIAGNVIEHTIAASAAQGRRFTLDLVADAALTATFRDDGLPVALDLSAVTMADEDDESGRGLALALAAVDRLDYQRIDGRNVWTLECARG
ncbi:ATP-binding protein [Microbacterium dauci]|uniref:ATP-binding protein n=1 Tax=Microbacterium dauci TaxID=3048008 RepID=A0ABT6ZBL2_9MICO|nr:ATP-binding protein [Microbacterium sp. LX3-4]MDJ1113547.1 ATP-binding protein [Microbacterium sp. LX3-4]